MAGRVRRWLRRVARALRRAVLLVGRPARADRGRGGLVVQPFRGIGSREEILLHGRVFRQRRRAARRGTMAGDLSDALRRLTRRGVRGAEVTARFAGCSRQVTTDADGYFVVHMPLVQAPPADREWHRVELQVAAPEVVSATGFVFIPRGRARQLVVSDIDDTVMFTGVANKAKMLWRMFMHGARSRVAFPGVGAFYRALHSGATGGEGNPVLYVSRGPWALYDVLDAFFNLHRIPVGPVLFLREWGIRLHWPLPRRARGHKLEMIRRMLTIYRDLPVVLIGDSGQHDPEIYARIVHEHPGRVLAVYIRNVSRGPGRRREIDRLAAEVEAAGTTLLLAADTSAMAEHALAHGLVAAEAVQEVLGERRSEASADSAAPVRVVEAVHTTRRRELDQVLEEGFAEDVELEPPAVNPARARRASRTGPPHT